MTIWFDKKKYREKILFLIRNDKEQLAKNIIKKIAKENYIEIQDLDWLYSFFSPIYDELFYDLMTKKLNITSSTKNLLEHLSLPFFKMEKTKKEKIFNKIL